MELLERVEAHIRRHELIEPGGDVLCFVSGGADSTCLLLGLRELGYRAAALHVDHGLRGEESDGDARFCAEWYGGLYISVLALRPLLSQSARGAGVCEADPLRHSLLACYLKRS